MKKMGVTSYKHKSRAMEKYHCRGDHDNKIVRETHKIVINSMDIIN